MAELERELQAEKNRADTILESTWKDTQSYVEAAKEAGCLMADARCVF